METEVGSGKGRGGFQVPGDMEWRAVSKPRNAGASPALHEYIRRAAGRLDGDLPFLSPARASHYAAGGERQSTGIIAGETG